MLNAARPFATQHIYTISLCDKFIQGLGWRILGPFCCFYSNHSTLHNLTGMYQRSQLAIILAAAQAAKDKVKQMQDIARGMLGQGFYSNIIGGGDVPAFPSQAKKTMSHYQDRWCKDHKRLPLQCFGCDSPHPWMRDKKILCPNGTDPTCIKHGEEKYKEFCAWLTKLCLKCGSNWRRQVVDFQDMDKSEKKRMHVAVFASMATDNLQASSTFSITASTSGSAAGKAEPAVFMLTVPVAPVFQVTPAHHTLPIQIQAAFLHIILQLGAILGCGKCPAIRCVIDIADALSTGNLLFCCNCQSIPSYG